MAPSWTTNAWHRWLLPVALAASACNAASAWFQDTEERPPLPGPARDAAPVAADADADPEPAAAAEPAAEAATVARMMASMEKAKPKLPAYAVVRDGARMFVSPDRGQGHFVAGGDDAPPEIHRYGYYGSPPPTDPEPTGRAVRIVAVSGDMFEIETVTADDPALTCAPLQPELSNVRARLWVDRESLVPVLDHPVTVSLDDETTVTLSPGVPAFATDEEGIFRIHAAGVELKVPLPRVPPTTWHQAAPAVSYEDPVGTFPAWYTMTLAGDNFPPEGPAGRQQGQLYGDGNGNTWVFADDTKDGQTRLRVKNRCMDVEGVVVTDPRNGKPSEPSPANARRRPLATPPHVLAGTSLRWDDGTPAGIATAPIVFSGKEVGVGQDTCFEISSDAQSPQLCVATSELDASPAKIAAADGLVLSTSTGWTSTPTEVALIDQMWEHHETVRDCFRSRVRRRPGYNYASANLSVKVGSDGKVSVNWASAYTSRGMSTTLQTCLEDVTKTFAVVSPPASDANVSLNLAATRH